ncbi:hypothetical protein [Ligilactobacillus acidipiscis]|uniref:YopX protein domain-containing protein n=1 Tax=Ligilactobacillus acidipiscis TaxID=89059 RepID=A0A921K133_9LACO|nr:hypothetical protein [Ligilactobacillus acidipiscis]WEV57865.1 hypothetical protein OZX66_04820 [Ligilactobacillus acidipiscis]HJE97266.1 hypothetical protein [Ligilactobacillus acidipiscis]
MFDWEPKLKVLDLYEGKVLEGNDIPVKEGNLPEILRQFSGQSYQVIPYTGITDINHKEIYVSDKVIVYKYEKNRGNYSVCRGEVVMNRTKPVVPSKEGNFYDLSDLSLEFEIVGNHFDHWEDINL